MGNSTSNDTKDFTKDFTEEIFRDALKMWKEMDDAKRDAYAGQPGVTLGQDGHLKFTMPTNVTQKETDEMAALKKETDEMAALKKETAALKSEMAALKSERELRELRAAEKIML